jgi:hypothetical protein
MIHSFLACDGLYSYRNIAGIYNRYGMRVYSNFASKLVMDVVPEPTVNIKRGMVNGQRPSLDNGLLRFATVTYGHILSRPMMQKDPPDRTAYQPCSKR